MTLVVVDPASDEARQCLASYALELDRRFEEGFDPASLVEPGEVRGTAGAFVVARVAGRAIGCGAVRTLGAGVGEIRHLWVVPDARGRGLSRTLLRTIEAEALARGLRVLRLDTHRSLAEAIGLYATSGYREIPRYNDNRYAAHWFEKVLERDR